MRIMSQRILVTGGNGYIGSHIIKYYLGKGCVVDSLDVGVIDNNNSANYYSIDITKRYKLSILKSSYDIIIHCAGSPSVPNSVKEPLLDFKINVEGALNMLQYAKESESKFIFLSTVSIFDTLNKLPLNENSIKKVTSPYGAAKLSAEAYCQAYYRTFGTDTRIARIFNTYGPGMKHLFVSDMIKKIKNSKNQIILGGSGNQIRDYVYISDLIQALDIIINKGSPGEDYNICSGKKVSLLKITNILLDKMGRKDLTISCDGKSYPGDIKEWYGKPEKLRKLGFNTEYTIEEGLEETINSKGIE